MYYFVDVPNEFFKSRPHCYQDWKVEDELGLDEFKFFRNSFSQISENSVYFVKTECISFFILKYGFKVISFDIIRGYLQKCGKRIELKEYEKLFMPCSTSGEVTSPSS